MAFAVFGKNIDRARNKAQEKIDQIERSPVLRKEKSEEDTELGLHCKNIIQGVQDQAQYERAFNEMFGVFYRRLRKSQISPEYDTVAAAKKFVELISETDSTAIIKQKIGTKFEKQAFQG